MSPKRAQQTNQSNKTNICLQWLNIFQSQTHWMAVRHCPAFCRTDPNHYRYYCRLFYLEVKAFEYEKNGKTRSESNIFGLKCRTFCSSSNISSNCTASETRLKSMHSWLEFGCLPLSWTLRANRCPNRCAVCTRSEPLPEIYTCTKSIGDRAA